MPTRWEWVQPELFLEHRGVKVWHTYRDDDIDQGAWNYWFTLNVDCGDLSCGCGRKDCPNVFDVRELPTWSATPAESEPRPPATDHDLEGAWRAAHDLERKRVAQAILSAIEAGHLRNPPTQGVAA